MILDINLPGMSSVEALRLLREWPETRDIPVIGLSAAALIKDTKHASEAGFYRYLTKPVKILELTQALEEILLRDRACMPDATANPRDRSRMTTTLRAPTAPTRRNVCVRAPDPQVLAPERAVHREIGMRQRTNRYTLGALLAFLALNAFAGGYYAAWRPR